MGTEGASQSSSTPSGYANPSEDASVYAVYSEAGGSVYSIYAPDGSEASTTGSVYSLYAEPPAPKTNTLMKPGKKAHHSKTEQTAKGGQGATTYNAAYSVAEVSGAQGS